MYIYIYIYVTHKNTFSVFLTYHTCIFFNEDVYGNLRIYIYLKTYIILYEKYFDSAIY